MFYGTKALQFDVESRQSTFELQPGRYELTHKQELGPLKFEVVSPSGEQVDVTEFGWFTQLFHTQDWAGHAFVAEAPGEYRLSIRGVPEGASNAHVNVSTTDTAAIARWAGGGMLLSALSCGLAMWFVLPTLCAQKKPAPRP